MEAINALFVEWQQSKSEDIPKALQERCSKERDAGCLARLEEVLRTIVPEKGTLDPSKGLAQLRVEAQEWEIL